MSNLKIKQWSIDDLISAEYNPRQISEKQFSELKDSIKRFGFIDPILVNVNEDRKGIIIGGHMRIKAAKDLGMDKVPSVELNLTLEQEKELNIRHNKSGGKFDFDALANFFEETDLLNWGFEDYELGMGADDFGEDEEREREEDAKIEKVEFSEFLREENNYVVLFFDNDIDWLQAKTHFSLKSISSKRGNGKEWSKGVGRVINGSEYFNKLNDGI